MSPLDPVVFTSLLAELHRKGTPENHMFGFPVMTSEGKVFHQVAWQPNWGVFYGNLLKCVQVYDSAANGTCEALDYLVEKTISDVIPKLLGPLQTSGRSLKPCLIHGNINEGNMGKDIYTGEIMIWNASSYYAHNEMELGSWRWSEAMKGFMIPYLCAFPASDPQEQLDDRIRLYSVKSSLNYSAVSAAIPRMGEPV
ncbi:MAG: hypothetical protein Q9163_005237 [Psora crenata]